MTIAFTGVFKQFGDVTALHDVSFTALPGQITGFVGRNGAGKSTAIRILLGLAAADAGTATIDGRCAAELPPHDLGTLLEPAAHPSARVQAHLSARAIRLGLPADSVRTALDLVGLTSMARRKFGKLSLGQRQRVALAGAFLGNPSVLILDEPANGLDPDGVLWLRNHLRALADRGATVLISSHLLAELERFVDAVVVLDQSVRWTGALTTMHQDGYESIESLFNTVTPHPTGVPA